VSIMILKVIVCIAILYSLYTLVALVVKIIRAGKGNWTFRTTWGKAVWKWLGILCNMGAAYHYFCDGNEGWMAFFGSGIWILIWFIEESIEIKAKKI